MLDSGFCIGRIGFASGRPSSELEDVHPSQNRCPSACVCGVLLQFDGHRSPARSLLFLMSLWALDAFTGGRLPSFSLPSPRRRSTFRLPTKIDAGVRLPASSCFRPAGTGHRLLSARGGGGLISFWRFVKAESGDMYYCFSKNTLYLRP